MKFVLNAILAKTSGAGGFQISYNFAKVALQDTNIEWHIIISMELWNEINKKVDFNINPDRIHVFPTQPDVHTYFNVNKKLKELVSAIHPDVVFSILAPSYFRFNCPEVMRCCNAWDLISSDHIVYNVVDKKLKVRMRLKSQLIRLLMRHTPYFITQTKDAKNGICKVTGTSPNNVCVVPNVLNSLFVNSEKTPIPHEGFVVLLSGALALHKNVMIIPEICSILKTKYKCGQIVFKTTFKESVTLYTNLFNRFKELDVLDMWENVGGLHQYQLIDIYRSSDMGFFPSLLETFSATLLEYMCFGLPTVMSNMPFNTDVMGDAAITYSPLKAEDAAKQIYKVYYDPKLQDELRNKGYKQLTRFANYQQYYSDTVNFLYEIAKNRN